MDKSSPLTSSLDDLIRPLASTEHRGEAFENDEDVLGQRGRTLLGQIRGQADEETRGDGHDALVSAFTGGNRDAALAWKDVPQARSQNLAAAESTEEHGLGHRSSR